MLIASISSSTAMRSPQIRSRQRILFSGTVGTSFIVRNRNFLLGLHSGGVSSLRALSSGGSVVAISNNSKRRAQSMRPRASVMGLASTTRLHGTKGTMPTFSEEAESKYFDHARLEREIYEWWESQGYFQPSDDTSKETYVIPMPPPNVTGYLHMGHAMFVALQDIMARFHRMRGKVTICPDRLNFPCRFPTSLQYL